MASLDPALKAQWPSPKGGFCIGVFLTVLKGREILLGKMTEPDLWVKKFLVGKERAEAYRDSGKWLLPARHLVFGEDPEEAANWVMKEQLGFKYGRISFAQVQNHLRDEDKPNSHWDICLVYHAATEEAPKRKDWFSELAYVPLSSLTMDDFTRGHGDIVKQLGLIDK